MSSNHESQNSKLETRNLNLKTQNPKLESDAPPPFFRSWRNLYVMVLGELVLVIVLFYLFMKAFR